MRKTSESAVSQERMFQEVGGDPCDTLPEGEERRMGLKHWICSSEVAGDLNQAAFVK